MKSALAIFAKSPMRGKVKTRLCPPLQHEQAADLYRAFLLDTMQIAGGIRDVEPGVLFAPGEAHGDFRTLAPAHFFLVAQEGDTFGERMANGFRALFERGYEAVAIMDADSPTLPRDHVQDLFERLSDPHCDVSVGPCEDGGYWAIGMKRLHLEVLTDIRWSSECVLAQTLRRASEAHLSAACAPTWYDVDDGAALEHLRAHLNCAGTPVPQHTQRALAQLYRAGDAPGSRAAVSDGPLYGHGGD